MKHRSLAVLCCVALVATSACAGARPAGQAPGQVVQAAKIDAMKVVPVINVAIKAARDAQDAEITFYKSPANGQTVTITAADHVKIQRGFGQFFGTTDTILAKLSATIDAPGLTGLQGDIDRAFDAFTASLPSSSVLVQTALAMAKQALDAAIGGLR